MEIRLATNSDLNDILAIYAFARQQMKLNHNPNQWGDTYPSLSMLQEDIEKKQLYLLTIEEHPCGVFAFILGEDPTYRYIEGGSWINDLPYGTIHRIASNAMYNGIFNAVLQFCETLCNNIRIDTHENNKIMQHLILQHGFSLCGTIYVDDGSPRIAYQKYKKEL